MPTMTRDQAIAVVSGAVKGIKAATWLARTDKKENRCPECNDTLCRRAQKWECNTHGVVRPVRLTTRRKGDLITRTFISKINAEKSTRNWTGVTIENSGKDGQCFNAPTREAADAIKLRKGLIGVLKMSGDQGDKQGVPITIPVFDLITLTVDGQTHDIVD